MTTVLSREQFRALNVGSPNGSAKKRNKYNAKRTKAPDGSRTYDSKAEASYCENLRRLERSGVISELVLQPRYPLHVNGDAIGEYRADARYRDEHGRIRIVDVKSKATNTALFSWKRRHFQAEYRIKLDVVTP